MYSFSKTEIRDLTKAWVAISIAFGMVLTDGSLFSGFVLSFFTVGIAFIFHEMGHKFVAQNYHLRAEFRSDDKMLILAIVMSFFGFVFAAPGAVVIMGHVGPKRYGKIALAGPAMNIILAVIFGTIAYVTSGSIQSVLMFAGSINAWLALFNMLPFGNFDGLKILRWDKTVYGVTLVVSAVLLFLL